MPGVPVWQLVQLVLLTAAVTCWSSIFAFYVCVFYCCWLLLGLGWWGGHRDTGGRQETTTGASLVDTQELQLSNININISINTGITTTQTTMSPDTTDSCQQGTEAFLSAGENHNNCKENDNDNSADELDADSNNDNDTAELIAITKATIGQSAKSRTATTKAWKALHNFNSWRPDAGICYKNVDTRSMVKTDVTRLNANNSCERVSQAKRLFNSRLFNSISGNIASMMGASNFSVKSQDENNRNPFNSNTCVTKTENNTAVTVTTEKCKNSNSPNNDRLKLTTSSPYLHQALTTPTPTTQTASANHKRRRTNFTVITRNNNNDNGNRAGGDFKNDIYNPTADTIRARLKRKCRPSRPLSRYVMERHWCLSRCMSLEEVKLQVRQLHLEAELDDEIQQLFQICRNDDDT